MKKKKRKLRVFEAFAGIGAQASALERMNIDYEIVGISDWFIDAIECYAAIHCDDVQVDMPKDISEIDKYLSKFTFSATSVKPTNIKRLTEDQRRDLYRANKKAKNYGSITDIKGIDLPDIDLLVYSFPCQDLSTGGLGKGMKKGSGTRSGLLWEIERILNELNELNKLPEYLLLENVKTIKAATNIDDLKQWLSFLESLGYSNNDCMILNSLDFGVPQDRERAFIVSHLGEKLDIDSKIEASKQERKFKIRKFIKTNYKNKTYKVEADIAQLNKTPSRDVMWDINGKKITNYTIISSERNITYTRYCDDLTFSGLFEPSSVKQFVSDKLHKMGFFLNEKKTVCVRDGQKMSVTGIVVNHKTNVSSTYRKNIRQEIYYCKKYGIQDHLKAKESNEPETIYLRKLLGRINYVLSIDPANAEFI